MARGRAGDAPGAIAAYRKALVLDAEAVAPRNNLALMLEQEGQLEEALAVAQAAFARAESNAVVMDTLGWLYLRAGRVDRAVALLEKARRIAPEAAHPRYHLAIAYRESGRTDEARELLNELHESLDADHELRARVDEAAGFAALSAGCGRRSLRVASRGRGLALLPVAARAVGVREARCARRTCSRSSRQHRAAQHRLDSRGHAAARIGPPPTASTPRSRPSSNAGRIAAWCSSGRWRNPPGPRCPWPRCSPRCGPEVTAFASPRTGSPSGALTLADVLRAAGYRTYAVQSNGWLEQSFGFHHGFDHYVFPRALNQAGQLGLSSVWPHGERVLEEANRLIDAHAPGSPFFLYLHFMDVHEYAAPPEFKNFGGGQEGSYLAAIRWVDDVVERVRERLEREGLSERTVMIFASDHGEAFGENRTHGHARNVFTPVLHVPLLIRFPFATEPVRVRTQVRNLDIAPTRAGHRRPGHSRRLRRRVPAPADRGVRRAGRTAPTSRRSGPPSSWAPWSRSPSTTAAGAWPGTSTRREGSSSSSASWTRWRTPTWWTSSPRRRERMRAVLDAHLSVKARADTRAANVRIDPKIAERLRAVGYLQ